MAVRGPYWRVLLFSILLGAVFSASVPFLYYARARAASTTIVISQIYGGGGNSGATYKNDFIELFNRGNADVNINGWSVQYASETGSSWEKTALTGSIAPGKYYLIQEAQGSGGTTNLPAADAIGTIAMSATAGKVALVNSTATLTGNCPSSPSLVDFVGYGTSADCREGSANAPAPSNTTAILRAANGCTDADNNASDFVAAAPNPRNSSTAAAPCSSPATTTSTPTPTSTTTPTSTSTLTRTSTPTSTQTNTVVVTPYPARSVVINEVAWGGTAASSSDEWIELFNTTSSAIALTGWTLKDGGDINIDLSGTIPASGYFLLERTNDSTITNIAADQIYTGGLSNSGETLTLKDPAGYSIDTVNGDGGGWPAGSSSGFYSMERKNPLTADSDSNWASNDGATRNGSDANGNAINGTPKQINSATMILTATPTPTKTLTPTATPTSTSTPTATATSTRTPTPTTVVPAATLLITQVLYDGTQTDEGDEFIEIFNPTATSVDLSNYKIGDEETSGGGEGMYSFPSGAMLAANGIVIVARNAEQFKNRFGFYPDYELVTSGSGLTDAASVPNLAKYSAWASGSLALSNSGDEVLLLGPSDQIVDAVAWGNGNFAPVNLSGDASAPEPWSLQRYGTYDANNMTYDFLADAPAPGTRVTPPVFPAAPTPAPMPNGMFAYWGDLHSHSTASDGRGPPRMAFDTARVAGLHFFGLTDHDSWLTTEEWGEIGNAATAATVNNAFIALRGFEYSHSSKGHVNVFNTATWVSRDDANYDTLSEFYAWLGAQSGAVAQFNHPRFEDGGDFDNFAFNSVAFDRIVLQEAGNNAHAVYKRYESQYTTSLTKGWRVAPTNNSDNHDLNWGTDTTHRVGVLMPALTLTDLISAFQARRVFSTEDANLALGFQASGAWMGSTITAQPTLNFTITASDANSEPAQVYLYDNGALVQTQSFSDSNFTWNVTAAGSSRHFYFARVVQSDGDIATSAPIWTDNTRLPTAIPSPGPTRITQENTRDRRMSIANVRTARSGTNVELEACVTVPPNVFSDRYIFVEDGSGGIKIELSAKRNSFPDLHLGDCVSLRGRVRIVSGERRVEVDDLTNFFVRGNGGDLPPMPCLTREITLEIEGQLIKTSGRVVSVDGNELVINDGSGDARVAVDATTRIRLPRLTVGQMFNVIGVIGRYRGLIAIMPRYASDLQIPFVPTPTRVPTTRVVPTRTPTQIAARLQTTPPAIGRATMTRTPPVLFLARPTAAPPNPLLLIDAEAFVTVGGSMSIAASLVMFTLGFLVMRRQKT